MNIRLTPSQLKLLRLMAENAGKTVTAYVCEKLGSTGGARCLRQS